MCGILGYISNTPVDDFVFRSALTAIHHRGPDADGIWKSNNQKITLGHKRLSIIDLSELAAQPMVDQDSGLAISYNGEVYNYKEIKKELEGKGHHFLSKSDTEVILYAWKEWGTNALNKLHGMFSFAVFDPKNQKLTLARDRVGEKPMFYYLHDDYFAFSSELKALLAFRKDSPQLDYLAMNCLLGMGYVPRDLCILNGYKKLNPGHFLEYDLTSGKHQIQAYWQLPSYSGSKSTEEQLAEELDILLSNAVKKQLEADVPVGVLLSGGLDSSLMTAYAAEYKTDLKTFTVSFPGYGQADEAPFARAIAKHYGTKHFELQTETAQPDLLYLLARQFDEPMTDPSIVPTYLLSKKIKEHCTVALGGDGGDELFGGYSRYQQWLVMQKNWGNIPLFARKLIAVIAGQFLPDGFRGKHYLEQLTTDFQNSIPLQDALFGPHKRKSAFNKALRFFDTLPIKNSFSKHGTNFADRAMRADFHSYMPDDVLVKVDRASMLSSLEVRAPILDIPVVEFAFGKVPSHLKVNTQNKKILLKKVAQKKLPKDYDFGRKQGFVPPLELWMKEKVWIDFFNDHLLHNHSPWWNKELVEQLWKGQQKGLFNKGRLFTLLMIELWRKEYNVLM